MFTSVGWGEIFVVLIVGLLLIGPERLPKVIYDLRAALHAARNAINNAKRDLEGEFGGEFEEFRKPLQGIAQVASMSPRAALTKTLLDGDDSILDSLNPQKIMQQDTPGAQQPPAAGSQPQQNGQNPGQPPAAGSGGGFSWADIT